MNTLGKTLTAAALLATFAHPAQAFDLKGAMDSANKAVDEAQKKTDDAASQSQSAVNKASGDWQVAGDTATLVNDLSSQLGVSEQQAAGGSAALFSMAQSQLSGEQFSGVTNQVSGLGALLGGGENGSSGGGLMNSALNNVNSLSGVQSAFSALGLSPEMISQFTPIITQFLGNQGVTGSLIGTLQKLWTPAQ